MAVAIRAEAARRPTPHFRTQLNASSLKPFVDPLPIPEIAKPVGLRPDPANPEIKIPYYRVAMRPFEAKLHRDLKPTRQWGYGGISPGPTFETRSGQGLLVEWANELPTTHFLPIDHTLHGAEASLPEVRSVVHLHGGRTPSESDGYPEKWYVPGKSATYHYPNQQESTMLWYHDHALGINRLNVFAGLLGAFFVRDEFEDKLGLPSGKYEIPLVIYDRIFDLEAQLNYPVSGDEKQPWVPEVFGDAILVNGKVFPFLEVEPRKYRFRVLNGANGRFFRLTLSNGLEFQQIGTDQGLLAAPVSVKAANIAPGERADVIIDFSEAAGGDIILKSEPAVVMQFRVARTGTKDTSAVPKALRPVPRIPETAAVQTRMLSLDEVDDSKQMPITMLLNDSHWSMPVTESPLLDSTEIWTLINPTDDSHPIHLHMVRFQILDRRPINAFRYHYHRQLTYMGPPVPPETGEMGWKDTVRAHPAMATRIIVKFEGYTGRYVWHCHILEHEDNEMMRPFDVVTE